MRITKLQAGFFMRDDLRTRKSGVSGWLLLDGVITAILANLIWQHWPSGSLWVIGALVGINMMMTCLRD